MAKMLEFYPAAPRLPGGPALLYDFHDDRKALRGLNKSLSAGVAAAFLLAASSEYRPPFIAGKGPALAIETKYGPLELAI